MRVPHSHRGEDALRGVEKLSDIEHRVSVCRASNQGITLVEMLKDANSNAKPTKYAQNKRHSMQEGTLSMMNLAPGRCSAPKTAKGMAKHKLLKTTQSCCRQGGGSLTA